ncbi:MAG: hypothetical protein ACR2GY_14175 [Phycisphaerales bacterium]
MKSTLDWVRYQLHASVASPIFGAMGQVTASLCGYNCNEMRFVPLTLRTIPRLRGLRVTDYRRNPLYWRGRVFA